MTRLSFDEMKERFKDHIGVSAYEFIYIYKVLHEKYKDVPDEDLKETLNNDMVFLKINENNKIEYFIVECHRNEEEYENRV